jgi:hypothetical protein
LFQPISHPFLIIQTQFELKRMKKEGVYTYFLQLENPSSVSCYASLPFSSSSLAEQLVSFTFSLLFFLISSFLYFSLAGRKCGLVQNEDNLHFELKYIQLT